MPLPEPTPTTRVELALDAIARTRAEQLLPHVRLSYVATGGERPINIRYVLTGAVHVGLNRWALRSGDLPVASTFTPKAGDDVLHVSVEVDDADLFAAEALAHRTGRLRNDVLSAAVCTGLAKLAGDRATHGPFEVTHGA